MKNKLTYLAVTTLAATLLLSGCSADTSTASGKLSDTKPPQGFVEESKKDNTIIFAALKDGKSSVDTKDFCGPIFDWAYSNGLTRFQIVDNTFELNDYTKDGTEINSKDPAYGAFVMSCNLNFNAISPDNKEINPKNWDKDIMFFGKTKENVEGSALVSAGYKGETKYVKLTVNFKDAK